MNREELLNRQAELVRTELSDWALGEGILVPGEKIVFSLRIEASPIIERDPTDLAIGPEPIEISPQCIAGFSGKYLKPATLSVAECEELIGLMSRGQVQEQLRTLLIEKRNTGSNIYDSKRNAANRVLLKPFKGRHYRIACGRGGSQLWEIRRT